MKHWLNDLQKILDSNSTDLKELAMLVSTDPTHHYVGCNLSNLDFSGQDLTGLEFKGASGKNTSYDQNTISDCPLFIFLVTTGAPYNYAIGAQEEYFDLIVLIIERWSKNIYMIMTFIFIMQYLNKREIREILNLNSHSFVLRASTESFKYESVDAIGSKVAKYDKEGSRLKSPAKFKIVKNDDMYNITIRKIVEVLGKINISAAFSSEKNVDTFFCNLNKVCLVE